MDEEPDTFTFSENGRTLKYLGGKSNTCA